MAVLLGLLAVARIVPLAIGDGSVRYLLVAVVGILVSAALILLWWLFASRASWRERIIGVFGLVLVFCVGRALAHPTMKDGGFLYFAIPLGFGGFSVGAMIFRKMRPMRRTWLVVLLAACGFCFPGLLRSSGMSGDYNVELQWRWAASPEERMLAGKKTSEAARPAADELAALEQALADPEWPGFRGGDRMGVNRTAVIEADWERHPPEQLWRIQVGPGWSSFAVAGGFLFTQEQRGGMEVVACYSAESGREVWTRGIESRFEEALGGPGPRATPTLAGDGLFALGAEGWLLRLSPVTGEIVWKRDLREVAGRKPPTWGFSSSPLVTGQLVVVHAGGAGDKGVLAFDIADGELRWSAPSGDHSYSSVQAGTLGGEECLLMLSNRGLDWIDPESGEVRHEYPWPVRDYRVLQPLVVGSDTVLLPTGARHGSRRIRITKGGGGIDSELMWASRRLKSDFNDCVIYQDHIYGFDAAIFTCIDLATGEPAWKGGRYGKGQVLLLEKCGLLLVAAEQGELVLLEATPEAHTELERFQALEGKTWNHPVLVGDRLYLRNSQEAACFRLALRN